jgi:RNA polymerase sigma-70 factor (ECF subfamily)
MIEQLYLKNIDRLHYISYYFCKNQEDADDLLQSSMLRAIKYFNSFSGDFLNWMFSIIRNIYRDSRTDEVSMSVSEAGELISDINVEDIILKKERIKEVKNAISKLRTKDKDIIKLYYFKGFSYDSIAELLQIPIGTVRSRLFNARLHLKKLLEG